MEEVERQLLATKSWKAPGEDGLPATRQWRHAKIIPLKKPNKENYTIAKAWRPISLLATLGKVLESVIAEIILHAVETYGLLPTSHFGARNQRSAEQALLLVQEQIYAAWRGRRVLSLISFDVKGAYNGAHKSDSEPFTIKGETVEPRDHVKILGVTMDTRLKYREQIARAASKGLEAAMELRRLRGLSPAIARQLFTSTVAPVVDYASNVWMHAFKNKNVGPINRVQRRKRRPTSPRSNTGSGDELRRCGQTCTPYQSPIPSAKVADALKSIEMETLETINPFILAPWEERVQGDGQDLPETQTETGGVMRIAVSSSARNEMVGFGVATEKQPPRYRKPRLKTFSVTLGTRTEQNPYSGELAAMAHAPNTLHGLKRCRVTLLTSNKAASLTLKNPHKQSGQEHICQIYKLMQRLRRHENRVHILWIPISEDHRLLGLAKEQARAATKEEASRQAQVPRMKSTTLNIARSQVAATLPGKHTRKLYDRLSWKEASVVAQLRTGMARLNGYLYRINVAETDQCACGQARETVEHFLFRCQKWTAHRTELLQCTNTHRGNISFFLGGKSPLDDQNWKPNLEAVRAAIRFAIATGRLDAA
ncbi:hypothetical protein N7526_001620 [Penicillium atrosanguineum]|nr:hypothetical protein N7526_001620 [Penicillium atrosanguineum]